MTAQRTNEIASAEDVYFGQVVANWARWSIIGAALMLVLWTSGDTFKLILGVLPIVGLMVVNFYLHGRYLANRPANGPLVAIASAIDIALITGLILLWPSNSAVGSGLFVLYFPALVAFAFIMSPSDQYWVHGLRTWCLRPRSGHVGPWYSGQHGGDRDACRQNDNPGRGRHPGSLLLASPEASAARRAGRDCGVAVGVESCFAGYGTCF